VVALSDSAGDTVQTYEYSVYGQVAASDPNHPNPYLFTGRRFDRETGLYYYRARYYNPYIGRFMQTDPVGYDDGLNWYLYCNNNPVNWVDPSGTLIMEPPCGSCEPDEPNEPDDCDEEALEQCLATAKATLESCLTQAERSYQLNLDLCDQFLEWCKNEWCGPVEHPFWKAVCKLDCHITHQTCTKAALIGYGGDIVICGSTYIADFHTCYRKHCPTALPISIPSIEWGLKIIG